MARKASTSKAAKRGVKPMAPAELVRACQRLGISQYALAPRLGLALRTLQGYALGERRVPGPLALLLRLLVRHPALLEELGE